MILVQLQSLSKLDRPGRLEPLESIVTRKGGREIRNPKSEMKSAKHVFGRWPRNASRAWFAATWLERWL